VLELSIFSVMFLFRIRVSGTGGKGGEVPGPSDRRAIYAVLRGAWTLRRLRDEASPQIMHLFEPRVTVPSP
jgi:hypothetical protein